MTVIFGNALTTAVIWPFCATDVMSLAEDGGVE